MPLLTPDVSHKKPQSIGRDGRFWAKEESAAVRTKPKQDVRQILTKFLWPRILSYGQDHGLPQTASVLADFACVFLNFIAIGRITILGNLVLYRNVPTSIRVLPSSSELGVLLIYGVLFALLGSSERLYHAGPMREPREGKIILGKVVVWATLLTGAVEQFAGIHMISGAVFVIVAFFNYLAMLGWRSWWQWRLTKNNRHERNVLIIGAGTLGRKVAAQLKQDHPGGLAVLGFLDNSGVIGDDVLGRIQDLARVARAEFVDEVIVALPHQHNLASMVIKEAQRNRLGVKLVLELQGLETRPLAIEDCGGIPLLTVHKELAPELGHFLKRVLDVTLSLLGLAMTAPLLAAIALIIKFDSLGPVFYRAPRIGKKGSRFLCCKFRTMVIGADTLKELLRARNERQGACFKITDDPRITQVGRFLRRYSLDELPQLWNVLHGDMSLVGPRPHPLDDFEQYDLEDLRRLDVTPGITGLWQVTARQDPSFQRNVALDVEYIEHWNLWMDLRILYKTVSVVLQGSGV